MVRLILAFVLLPALAFAQASGYEKNAGQWPADVLARHAFGTSSAWIKADRVRLEVFNHEDTKAAIKAWHSIESTLGTVHGHVYDMVFGSTASTEVEFIQQKTAFLNYYLGSDSEKWKTKVPQFDKIRLHDVRPHVDVLWELANGQPKYTFEVGQGANLDQLFVAYEGQNGLKKMENGNLLLSLNGFNTMELAPVAFQYVDNERIGIECTFRVEGNKVFYDVGSYDKTQTLYIDPIIVASTHSGSTAEAFGHSAAFDGLGNMYSAGRVFNNGYPTNTGSFDLDFNGPFLGAYFNRYDVCISKYNTDGSELLYATYLGGSVRELPHSLIVNNQNELLVLGSVLSPDFPTTNNAFDQTQNGGQDIFISRFSVDGSELIASTFLGGSGIDGVNNIHENYADDYRGEIVVDDSNYVYIASFSTSTDFPTTSGAIQTTNAGNQDAVVVKLTSDLSALDFSTYLGGFGNDGAFALKVGKQNHVYVCGSARAQGFPVDPNGPGAFPDYIGGNSDAFVLELNADGSEVLHSSYYGTVNREHAFFLELDDQDHPYLFGWSNGGITSSPGLYQGPSLGSFICKFTPNLDSVLWECGFGKFSPSAFLVDVCSHIYVSGQEAININTPNNINLTKFDTINSVNNLDSAGFYLMALEPDASEISHGFFYGTEESHVDGGTSRFDKRGFIYQNVCNCSGDFPTVPWAYATTNQVSAPAPSLICDNCAFKIDFEVPLVAAYSAATPYTGCEPLDVEFTNEGSVGTYHYWDFGDGSTSTDSMPSHTFDTAGTYKVKYVISDSFGCNATDTAVLFIEVLPDETISIDFDSVNCSDSLRVYLVDTSNLPLLWNNGDTAFETYAHEPGTFWLLAETPNCGLRSDTIDVDWLRKPYFELPEDTGICQLGFNIQGPDSALSYQWSTGDTTQSIEINNTGSYSLTISNGVCTSSDSLQIDVSYVNFNNSDTSLCEDDLLLQTENVNGQTLWSTGDTTESITIQESGIYWATVSNGFCVLSDTIRVQFNPPLFSVGMDTIICGPATFSVFDTSFVSYRWSTGDTNSSVTIDQTAVLWVAVSDGACSDTDTFNITKRSLGFDLRDFVLCDSDSFALPIPGPADGQYVWSTGDTSASLNVKENGRYFVTITAAPCSLIDSVDVQFYRSPRFSIGDNAMVCRGLEHVFTIDSISGGVLWNTGDTTASIVVNEAGRYIASMTRNGCTGRDTALLEFEHADFEASDFVPNIITPNGDEWNNTFGLRLIRPDLITAYHLIVYNRWGVEMFETYELDVLWDGTNRKGNLVEEGTYFFLLEAETKCTDYPIIEVKDNVTVLH